jgi:hypothetical protein
MDGSRFSVVVQRHSKFGYVSERGQRRERRARRVGLASLIMKSVLIRGYLSPDLLRDEEFSERKLEADEVVERLVNASPHEFVKSCAGCWPPSPTPWTLSQIRACDRGDWRRLYPCQPPRWSNKSAALVQGDAKVALRPAPKTSGLSAKNDRCGVADPAKIELQRDW